MTVIFGEEIHGQIAWKEGEWYLQFTRQTQGQFPQVPPDAPPFPKETVLRKASIDELVAYVKKHCVVATVEETAAILRLGTETIYRMVDRGDLDRVPGIRHVRIPLNQVIFVSQGCNKDGSAA